MTNNNAYRSRPLQHYSILIGQSGSGKDTFLYNTDNNLLFKKQGGLYVLRFGDHKASSTRKLTEIDYENEVILENYAHSGCIVITRGLPIAIAMLSVVE